MKKTLIISIFILLFQLNSVGQIKIEVFADTILVNYPQSELFEVLLKTTNCSATDNYTLYNFGDYTAEYLIFGDGLYLECDNIFSKIYYQVGADPNSAYHAYRKYNYKKKRNEFYDCIENYDYKKINLTKNSTIVKKVNVLFSCGIGSDTAIYNFKYIQNEFGLDIYNNYDTLNPNKLFIGEITSNSFVVICKNKKRKKHH